MHTPARVPTVVVMLLVWIVVIVLLGVLVRMMGDRFW